MDHFGRDIVHRHSGRELSWIMGRKIGIPITICGRFYPSYEAAARSAGITNSTLRQRIKAGWPESEWLNPPSKMKPTPVRCIETGEVLPSVRQAALEDGVGYSTLYQVIAEGTRTKAGHRWEYVE